MSQSSHSEHDEKKSQKRSHEAGVDAAAQLANVRNIAVSITEEVGAYVQKQPVAAVGIAVGAGFVLGSVFGSRLGRFALMAAAGYAAQSLMESAMGEGGLRKILVEEVSKMAKGDRAAS